ncbi:MAG: cell wall-binding repeat-containing protein [Actinobacteria bacterium]|nr:cell wall-binding repeat-containing protein [Actinomycetota bacterium]
MHIGYYDSTTGWCRGLVRFDLPADLLTGGYVQSADLYLRQNWQSVLAPSVARVGAIDRAWSESSTYNSLGGHYIIEAKEVATVATRAQDLHFDFTQVVQRWATGQYVNHGFAIYQEWTEGQTYWRKILSKEHPTSSYRPKLTITYTAPLDVTASPFNAKGDGTTDDTVAIQGAINAADSSGGVVYFPSGTYKVSGLNVTKSNVVLRGLGTASVLVPASTAQGHLIQVGGATAVTNVLVENLNLRLPASGGGLRVAGAGGGGNVRIRNNTFSGGNDSATTHALGVAANFTSVEVTDNDLALVTSVPLDIEGGSGSERIVARNTMPTAPYRADLMWGIDRYHTAIRLSQAAFPTWAEGVVLVSGEDYPDALSAGPLAAAYGGPTLLTHAASLDVGTKAELQRLNPSRVFVVGLGTSVSDAVTHALPSAQVTRLAGATRYDTAALVAAEVKTKRSLDGLSVTKVVIVPGDDYPDGLTSGPMAAKNGWPILLTPKAGPIPAATQTAYQTTLGVNQAVVVGVNTGVTIPGIASPYRINGTDVFATSRLVAEYAVQNGSSYAHTALATGLNFPDALAAGSYLGADGGVLLLTNGTSIAPDSVALLKANYAALDTLDYIALPSLWEADENCGAWLPEAPQHTSVGLGVFARHEMGVRLDQGALQVAATDLAIDSFGPSATLTRVYSSARTTETLGLPGWRYTFEQSLSFPNANRIDYTDPTGDIHIFVRSGPSTADWWTPPAGYAANLGKDDSEWKLKLPGGNTLVFDSSGVLLSETDPNDNTTTYTYTGGVIDKITAPNAQVIDVSVSAGVLTDAVYTTADGSRGVAYDKAAKTVTYLPGVSGLEHVVSYTYSGGLVSSIKALDYTSSSDPAAVFTYSSGLLTQYKAPDYNATTNPDARTEIAYGTKTATLTAYGSVYSASAITGAANTPITQIFTWNDSGTMASKTNPKTSSESTTETWYYQYEPRTNLQTQETDPLGKTRTWTYNLRGNQLTETDQLNRTTTYSYPDTDPGIPHYLQIRVAADGDDARKEGSTVYATGWAWQAVGKGSSVLSEGWRFRNVDIPKGATVRDARVHLYAAYDANGNPASVVSKIGLEDADNPGAWAQTTHEPVLSKLTTAQATWSVSAWKQGQWYSSPDLSASVTEVIGRTGWAAGNSMAVIWADNGTASGNYLKSGDYYGGNPALFTVYYTVPFDLNRDEVGGVTDPLGSRTTVTRDERTNPTEVTRTLNGTQSESTKYTYDDEMVGSATYKGALTLEEKLISGTWGGANTAAATDYDTGGYATSGQPNKVVQKAVALQEGQSSPPDLTTTYTFDDFGQLETEKNPDGVLVADNDYDEAGRLLTSTGPAFPYEGGPAAQVKTHHVYNGWGFETETYQTSSADLGGAKYNRSVVTYDRAGRVLTVKDRLSSGTLVRIRTNTYDGRGLLISTDDTTVSDRDALTAYDARGQVVATWAGGTCTSTYDISKATRYLDGTTPAYDALGRVTKTAPPGDDPTTFTYHDDGRLLKKVLPDGSQETYTYDAGGNLTQTVSTKDGTSSATYDLGGRRLTQTSAAGLTTSFTYDLLSRVTSAGAGSTASTYAYNTLGWQLRVTDADGFATTRVFDKLGRTISETTAEETTTSTYDPAAHLTKQVDHQGRWRELSYDLMGRVTRDLQTLPGTPRVSVKDTTLAYDSLGRVLTTSDAVHNLGHTLTYPVNTAGPTTDQAVVGTTGTDSVQTTLTVAADGYETSRASVIASSPQLPTITRMVGSRDAAQRPTSATTQTGASTSISAQYSYDTAGRLKRQWGPTGTAGSGYLAGAATTDAYTYSATTGLKTGENLRLQSVGTAGAITASYTYTTAGRLATATINGVLARIHRSPSETPVPPAQKGIIGVRGGRVTASSGRARQDQDCRRPPGAIQAG